MPELPEVQTIADDLRPRLVGRVIKYASIEDPLLVRFPCRGEFCRRLTGKKIISVNRRGKYLSIELEGQLTWTVHLRMTGRLLLDLPGGEKYVRGKFDLDDGSILWYCDLRRFGDMWAWYPGEEQYLGGYSTLGPEPLEEDFCPAWLGDKISGRRAPVKSLLLDQRIIAGLGNIYVDEVLFQAGIHPRRPGNSITGDEVNKLCLAVRSVLRGAIVARGTTFRDYRSGRGTSGEYQQQLRVYGRGGEECLTCGSPLERLVIGGRSSTCCPRCQT